MMMMTMMMTEQELLALLAEALESVAPGRSDRLDARGLDTEISALGIDSVTTMEMVGFVEEKLDVTFPDEDLAQVSSMRHLANLVTAATT